jgi:hypothetical protein
MTPMRWSRRNLGLVTERHRQGGLLRRVALPILLALATGLVLGLGMVSPASAHSAKGASGFFTFRGDISGTLEVPAHYVPPDKAGCSSSSSENVITWKKVKLKLDGRTQTYTNLQLVVQVSEFGHTYSLAPSQRIGKSLGAVFLKIPPGYGSALWVSDSGTITIANGGKSGSVKGTLYLKTLVLVIPPATATIKGSWTGCTKLNV